MNKLNNKIVVFSIEETCFLLTFAWNSNVTESETSQEEAGAKNNTLYNTFKGNS